MYGRYRTLLSAIALVIGAAGQADAAEDGQLAFNNHCRTCHSTDASDNRLGPNLHQIIGRKAGAAKGYRYSSSFQSSDFTWTEEKMEQFIEDPDSVVRGNNMKPYSGIEEAEVRKAIVGFLAEPAS